MMRLIGVYQIIGFRDILLLSISNIEKGYRRKRSRMLYET